MAIPEISSYLPPFANAKPPVYNPVVPSAPTIPSYLPKREVEYVEGENGAQNVAMGPNSSGLFLDRNENVLWVVATDQNGGKSLVKGYHIGEEYVPPKPVTLDDLMAQMKSMNERLNKMEDMNNGQHNFKSSGQSEPVWANGSAGIGSSQGGKFHKPDAGVDASE